MTAERPPEDRRTSPTGNGTVPLRPDSGTPECCTVCGRPDDNLSIPFGRCLPCIRAASAAWEVAQAASRSVTSDGDTPAFYDLLFGRNRRRAQPRTFMHPGSVSGRLRGLLTTINRATEGTRNTVLHWAACRVGEMLAAGELSDAHRAADALREVAIDTGLGPGEVESTIRSGFGTSGVYL